MKPPAGGSTSVMGTVRRRCGPRSGRCGSRSPGTGPGRSLRGSSRSTPAASTVSTEAILSLYAKGLTTGEIAAHLAYVYDAEVSRELIGRVRPLRPAQRGQLSRGFASSTTRSAAGTNPSIGFP